jgi:hypothetical protein
MIKDSSRFFFVRFVVALGRQAPAARHAVRASGVLARRDELAAISFDEPTPSGYQVLHEMVRIGALRPRVKGGTAARSTVKILIPPAQFAPMRTPTCRGSGGNCITGNHDLPIETPICGRDARKRATTSHGAAHNR